MINRIHAFFHRPESGWDPVPLSHAQSYSEYEWSHVDEALVSAVEQWAGGVSGKRVLDLGAGPGHYSAAFARRGALVTWHDISQNYLRIARERSAALGLDINFSLGYLEAASRFASEPFDLVFSRGCWNYAINEPRLARLFFALVKKGGHGFIYTPIYTWTERTPARKLQRFLYNSKIIRIGHPFPPRGGVRELMSRFPVTIKDRSNDATDQVFFTKL